MTDLIGFIGLGNLGTPIASNLLDKGHKVHVYNRTKKKAESLLKKGAIAEASVASLAKKCDVVFSIVSDDAAVKKITEGDEGISINLRRGGIHICMSTILPKTSNDIAALHAKYGSIYIASPVMGRPEAAVARKLNFLISGNAEAKEKIKPLLVDAGGANVWEYGDLAGNANVTKLCTNFLIASAISSMAESFSLARKSGVEPESVLQMIGQTLFNCPIYNNYGRSIVDEKYIPAGFTLQLGLKDVNLVVDQAKSVQLEMQTAQLLKGRMEFCVENGLGNHDWTALAKDLMR